MPTKVFDYIIVYLTIAFSVVPFFSTNEMHLAGSMVFMFFVLILTGKLKNIPRVYSYFFSVLIIVLFLQSLSMGYLDIRSHVGTLTRFFFPFFALLYLRNKFVSKYINIVYCLSIVGLILFVFKNTIPGFNNILIELGRTMPFDDYSKQHFIIYSSRSKEHFGFILSNSGFAYEPGAYSIILSIAIILNIFRNGTPFDRKGIIFIISVLSGFSSAGYISLFIILMGYYYDQLSLRSFFKVFSFSSVILIAYFSITRVEFLGEKIEQQMQLTQNPYETRGRFASAMADIRTWQMNPVWGTGKSEETYLQTSRSLGFTSDHRVNGLANFLAKFGAVFFLAYLYLLYKSLKKKSEEHSFIKKAVPFFFLALLAVAFAQICMLWSVYITMLYLPLTIHKKLLRKINEKKHIGDISQ